MNDQVWKCRCCGTEYFTEQECDWCPEEIAQPVPVKEKEAA